MGKKKLTPEERARLRALVNEIRADLGEMRSVLEQFAARSDEWALREARRRARLRRLTVGLLGRS